MEKAAIVYHDYVNLKLHFNKDGYLGHDITNSKKLLLGYKSNKDRMHFERIAELFKSRDVMKRYFVSGFLYDKNMWIGDFVFDIDQLSVLHSERVARVRNMMTVFNSDCVELGELMSLNKKTLRSVLCSKSGRPEIMDMGFSLETLAIFDRITSFCSSSGDDPLWKEESFRIFKYKYFLNFSRIRELVASMNTHLKSRLT